VALPRFVSEFALGNAQVLYWLATLTRASYSPTSALFERAVRAVLPASYTVLFVPNGVAGTPGYGLITLPQGAIMVVSGTTQLSQWLEQVLENGLVDWTTAPGGPLPVASMTSYNTNANRVLAALNPTIPNDDQVLFVGHSMGGAVAQLCHYWCSKSTGNVRTDSRCVSFSAPKPGDARLRDAMRKGPQVFRRLQIEGDFVPILPPDLGIFNLAVPAPLQPVSTNWSRYKQPGQAYYVRADGTVTPGEEPFLPLLVTGAVVAVAAGNPLAPVNAHMPRTYTERLAAGFDPGARGSYPDNWQNPTDLPVVNADLAAVGL